MGNFSSQYFEEWIDSSRRSSNTFLIKSGENEDNFTPKNKRWLPTDPRSPSSDIRRTPIVVEKTPNPSHKSLYTVLTSAGTSVDENEMLDVDYLLDSDELEEGEEANESTTFGTSASGNSQQSKNLLQNSSSNQRSPLKILLKRNIDSPVMYLRYKQIKGIKDEYSKQLSSKQVEMSDVACNDGN